MVARRAEVGQKKSATNVSPWLASARGVPITDQPVTMSRVADPTARISLLRAAEEVFAKKGLESAKVEEIARLAGVSKGAFYLHFAGKEEAFLQVVEAFLARCGSLLRSPSAELLDSKQGQDIAECGVDENVELFEFLWQNRAILAILHTCKGDYAYLFEAFHRDLLSNAKGWVELFMRRGLYRADLDPQLVATLVVGAHGELAKAMLASERKPPLRDWLLATHRVFALGLTADHKASTIPRAPSSRVTLPTSESSRGGLRAGGARRAPRPRRPSG